MRLSQLTSPFTLRMGLSQFRTLDLIPTWSCNAKCVTCEAWKRKSAMLSFDKAKQIYRDPFFKDLELVIIEGGEVSLWEPLVFFVDRLLELRKCQILIITNGLDPDFWQYALEYWKISRDCKKLRFVVSLNGWEGNNDYAHGVDGAFDEAIHTLSLIKAFGHRATVQYVPFKFNEDDYPKIAEYARSNGFQIIVDHPSFATKFKEAKKLEPVDPEKLREMYRDRIKHVDYQRGWARAYFYEKATKGEYMPCRAGKAFLHIDPEGIIRPCAMNDQQSFGQLTDDGVEIHGSQLRECLKNIPECMYQDGQVCCDYLPISTLQLRAFELIWWRLKKLIRFERLICRK